MTRNIFLSFFAVCMVTLFNSCTKEYSLENGITTIDAVGSLKDSSGNCMAAEIFGTYYNGITPGSDTAYVEIMVDVDSAGSYTITTDLQNGFMFADSGFFSSTGINIVKLKPVGTPILQKPTFFTVIFDTSICSFTVNVEDSTGTGLGGGGDTTVISTDFTWQFTANGTAYAGNFYDTSKAYIYDSIVGGLPIKYITMDFISPDPGDTLFQVSVINTGGPITATYHTNVIIPNGGLFLYTDPSDTFGSDPLTFIGTDIAIVVTTYDTSTKIIEGTFSGTALTGTGTFVDITEGKFKSRLP